MILRVTQIYVFVTIVLLIFFSESVPKEWVDAIERSRIGWMVLGTMAGFLVIFIGLNFFSHPLRGQREPGRPFLQRWHWPLMTLSTAAAMVIGTHLADGPTSTQLLRCCLLIGGMLAGQIIRFVWQKTPAPDLECSIDILLLILCFSFVISPFHTSGAEKFVYWGQSRWSGPWENPNNFGLLMAVGVILVLGQLLKQGTLRRAIRFVGPKGAEASQTSALKTMTTWFLIAMAPCLVLYLFKSYSRGAWLAALLGGGYLVWRSECWLQLKRVGWIWRNWLPLACCLGSVALLTFYASRHVEWAPARRVTSVANKNDFSWRNRVRAWEGAMQNVAEKPWFGNGPMEPDALYTRFYRTVPSQHHDPSILLNDYCTTGMTFGLVSLVCLLGYVGVQFRTRTGSLLSYETGNVNILQISCQAAIIAMLTVFFFDGGLFKMPTAIAFWVLLETCRVSPVWRNHGTTAMREAVVETR
jgi:hypothetical protein